MKQSHIPNRQLTRINRRRRSLLPYAVGAAAALLLLVGSVTTALLLNKAPKGPVVISAGESSAVSQDVFETLPPETTAAAETTAATAVGTATTAAPTTLVPPIPAHEPVGDDYFKDAVFIGDSRTKGLQLYSGPSAAYYAEVSMTVERVFSKQIKDLGNITIAQALEANHFGKAYIMLGVNELGWTNVDGFINRYGQVVDKVKATQPGAAVYIQSILPVTAEKSAQGDNVNNNRINQYNLLLQKLCVEKGVYYLNVREAVETPDGALPADAAAADGVHMNKTYCDKWMEYIRTHTVS